MSTSHTGTYCDHKDKMCMSKQDAIDACRSMSKAGKNADKYLCKECGTWHLCHRVSGALLRSKRSASASKSKRQ